MLMLMLMLMLTRSVDETIQIGGIVITIVPAW